MSLTKNAALFCSVSAPQTAILKLWQHPLSICTLPRGSNGQSSSLDWRSTARGFLEKLKYILVHNIMADLTIQLVNNGKIDSEYNVHSFLFIIGSEVFEKMLNSTFKEGVLRVIEIKDVDPDIFQMLINYFYGLPVDLENMTNLKKVKDLADISDYYLIHGLKDEIAKYFESVDTPQAACLGLNVAEKCNAPKLKAKKLQYIVSHTKEVVEQEEFLSLPEEDISLILEQCILEIKEIDLFKAVEAWIKRNVDKYGKRIIDSLIPKIRYLSMTREEFTLGPAKSNLIKLEDLVALYSNLNVEGSMPLPSGFSTKRWNEIELNFERAVSNTKCYTYVGGDRTCKGVFGIKANKSITVEGFRISTLNGNPTESYDEDIEIRAGYGIEFLNNFEIVGKFKGKINYSSSFFVQLDKNLEISKETSYYVWVIERKGSRNAIDLKKPLDEEDITLPLTCIHHPKLHHFTSVMSMKLASI